MNKNRKKIYILIKKKRRKKPKRIEGKKVRDSIA